MNRDQIEGKWTEIKGRVREAVISLSDQQKQRIKEGAEELQRVPCNLVCQCIQLDL